MVSARDGASSCVRIRCLRQLRQRHIMPSPRRCARLSMLVTPLAHGNIMATETYARARRLLYVARATASRQPRARMPRSYAVAGDTILRDNSRPRTLPLKDSGQHATLRAASRRGLSLRPLRAKWQQTSPKMRMPICCKTGGRAKIYAHR